ncbi:MAG: hypothetical protein EAX95_10335 [Candidatus Thorarchaeota archaeon]|nr:hypothetical protein [Candidatus Thorarchaeota archaeon]
MPWDIENYYINSNRVLTVEITVPLMEFMYTNIEDVKDAWFEMLSQFVNEHPGFEMSWEMQPREMDALVMVRIAKVGTLEDFTSKEASDALAAADGLFEKEPKKQTPKKTNMKPTKTAAKKK